MGQDKDMDALFGNALQACDRSLETAVRARVRLLATELHEAAVKYESQYDRLAEYAAEHTASVTYAGGGTTARRGYYAPSPILHQLVSSVKKSRLLQEPPKSGDYFAYHWDVGDRLLRVDQYAGNGLSSQEFLVRGTPKTVRRYGKGQKAHPEADLKSENHHSIETAKSARTGCTGCKPSPRFFIIFPPFGILCNVTALDKRARHQCPRKE